ncbi:MAG: FAD:protein FMN transferase [Oscillospiraceae bacterium]|nr:FAD:protein FMN transferase [Oscillospiraceae bacterium]
MKRLIAIILVCVLLGGCSAEARKTVYHMNTVMDLKITGRDADIALARAETILTDLESLWSVTAPDSPLSRINRGTDVQLDPANRALLDKAEALSRRTGGAFNPKLRCLSEVWGFYNESYRVPTDEEIAAALKEAQWDLGAALKGHAGAKIAADLQQLNVHSAILNLGGNVQTYGTKADGTPWQIGIQDPDGGNYLGVVSVSGTMAVVTSGDYQRFFEADGVRYHHILDPETGYPADSGLRSVTVICADGMTADALSTALFVMGLEEGSALWRESNDFEAVFITADGSIFATEGANLSGCTYEVISR